MKIPLWKIYYEGKIKIVKKLTLGEFIAVKRKEQMMTQEELAEKMYVSKSAVAKWETNGGIPERDNLYKLAEVLEIPVEELYYLISGKRFEASDKGLVADLIEVFEKHGYIVTPREKGK